MTDRDIVERVAALFERSIQALRARKPHHKRPYATTIKGAPAVALMKAVRPVVGTFRQRDIDRSVASWHGRPARWRRPSKRCEIRGCARAGSIRGLCGRHYDRWWKATRRGRVPLGAPREAPSAGFAAPIPADCSADCEVAWLAGLLEGEGTFAASEKGPNSYPVVSVQMCDISVVRRAAAVLGAASLREHRPQNERWSIVYAATISGARAADWMHRLRPFMGIRRAAAIDNALANYGPIRLTTPPTTCVVPGCTKPHRSRGLCHKHYMLWSRDMKNGRTLRVTPLR
jgi:hypothetical protein